MTASVRHRGTPDALSWTQRQQFTALHFSVERSGSAVKLPTLDRACKSRAQKTRLGAGSPYSPC